MPPVCPICLLYTSAWAKSSERAELAIANFRERQTYYGAIDHQTGETTITAYPAENSHATAAFIHELRQKYTGKRLLLIWDGSKAHTGAEIGDLLREINASCTHEAWHVTCMLFAPYDPSQNPIETMWLQAKQALRARWWECTSFRKVKEIFLETIQGVRFFFANLRMYAPHFGNDLG